MRLIRWSRMTERAMTPSTRAATAALRAQLATRERKARQAAIEPEASALRDELARVIPCIPLGYRQPFARALGERRSTDLYSLIRGRAWIFRAHLTRLRHALDELYTTGLVLTVRRTGRPRKASGQGSVKNSDTRRVRLVLAKPVPDEPD